MTANGRREDFFRRFAACGVTVLNSLGLRPRLHAAVFATTKYLNFKTWRVAPSVKSVKPNRVRLAILFCLARDNRPENFGECVRLAHEAQVGRVRTINSSFVIIAQELFTLQVIQIAIARAL